VTGREFREERRRLRMSQEELARKMGKHRNTISAKENGRSQVTLSDELALRQIAATMRPGTLSASKRTP
jgi:transcriptional regulator with XRE-family HTH domain